MTEEEVKLRIITPAIEKAGWDKNNQINMEYTISPGKVVVRDNVAKREKPKFADYLLSYKYGIPLAIVEAKDDSHNLGDGMLQAKQYAEKLNVRFVFTSNGSGFLFYDMETGIEKELKLEQFPSPKQLYDMKYSKDIEKSNDFEKIINTPYYYSDSSLAPRYYQTNAINKTVEAIAKGQDRILLVMATGTGKTYTAFQIIWRLHKAGLKKKVLYLADRNILVDQSITGDFKPFNNTIHKISHKDGEKFNTSYEVYFALYQQLSENGKQEDSLDMLKKSFPADYFDLVIVDECHRGSAREESNWRKILDYFKFATKIGMTATPKETDKVSNIDYFGEPIYVYSLKDGIEDGYLAPYRVIRYSLDKDVTNYIPEAGKLDKFGNPIEEREYSASEFDRKIVIDDRTRKVAQLITKYLKETDRMAKTIVFCVDIDHAERMRSELTKLNADMMQKDHRYIMRITGDDKEGKAQLDHFIEDNEPYPTIVTTSKLLNTGVNCRMCKNIVLDNFFGEHGMTEFKQIIGRGTRIVENKGKLFFTILDFRNASILFSDPEFDGTATQSDNYDPSKPVDDIKSVKEPVLIHDVPKSKKIYVDGVEVELLAERVQFYDKDGKLITENLRDYTKKNILLNYKDATEFTKYWNNSDNHKQLIDELESKGVCVEALRSFYNGNVDDFDLILDIAYGVKPIAKFQRIKNKKVLEVLGNYSEKCQEVLEALLTKYAYTNICDLTNVQLLKTEEFNKFGGQVPIIKLFGGKAAYIAAVSNIQKALYC